MTNPDTKTNPVILDGKYPTHSRVGGYSITYIDGCIAYCGNCVSDETKDTEHIIKGVLTYHDEPEAHNLPCGIWSGKVTCRCCNVTISN